MIDLFDLPKLTTLSLGYGSFAETSSITLSSTSLISSSSDVPFSNGHYSIDSSSNNWTFRYITSSSITSDSTSSRLKNCILNKGSLWFLLFPPHLNSLTMVHSTQKSSIPAILPSHISMFIIGAVTESHLHWSGLSGLTVQRGFSGVFPVVNDLMKNNSNLTVSTFPLSIANVICSLVNNNC